ncbi:carbon starvation protein A [Pelagicoccus sp. SDUM812003]|uniref:carbon starvation CstA family protein n=1 Tax=Pelagicoccus sp. SDUM812003 TaxID=3041267 RepID=UPI0028100FE8|nr:carbon starvation protein A [Pelagicoccus sp. SDUM812003]MDQ8202887.1 carbon starvation protein A [Pelagicoccus sp. SDUM812003]
MQTLFIAIGAGVLYLVAYHTYGKYLARRIFKLRDDVPAPSVALNDDRDFVPTDKFVVFGHHFTSIAGTGPIVGPAIAVIWGWAPALLWVLFGSILLGAVHDFGSLVVSLRNRGQTVGEISGRVLNPRIRLLFLIILFFTLTIVLAIFGLVIAVVFRSYPSAIFPCLVQIPLAVAIGVWLHRKGVGLLIPSVLALVAMYVSVAFGDRDGPIHAFNAALAAWPNGTWVVALLLYSYIASVLPVWSLLQPRDFINSLQLITALALVVVGLLVAAFFGGAPVGGSQLRPSLEIAAPAFQSADLGAPLIFPFLFITVACGAISGFHCLVSSGTSSKQLRCETDAQFVGYGSMLLEGFLATLVILACVAGLGLGITGKGGELLMGEAAFADRYASWAAAGGLASKVGAFVDGSANFLKAIGLPAGFSVALMGVLVASFAATTLDTACRLQRYVVQELAGLFVERDPGGRAIVSANPVSWLTDKHGATVFAVGTAFLLAAFPPAGKEWAWENVGVGGMILWPMFGATNQLLGGLAFLVVAFWMWRRRLPVWFVVLPTAFMLVMPAWAMGYQLLHPETGWLFAEARNWPLVLIALATIVLEAWMLVEAFLCWPKAKGVLEQGVGGVGGAEASAEGGRSC